jgi:hypothetical protein
VYLLRQRRDHGWTPLRPAPRADTPEELEVYFTQVVAEQARERTLPEADTPAPPAAPARGEQPPSLADVWQDALATLHLRLPREVYLACVRQAKLVDVAGDKVTIGVADARLKEALGRQYATSLRLALRDVLRHDVTVRGVMHMPA